MGHVGRRAKFDPSEHDAARPWRYLSGSDLRYKWPVAPGDAIKVSVTAIAKDQEKYLITLDSQCKHQNGEIVISGRTTILAPWKR